MSIIVPIKRLPNYPVDELLPGYATQGSAGVDLRAASTAVLEPGHRVLVPTGIAIAIPPGYEAQVRSRSGLALKAGLVVANSPGTIDSDYRGEIGVILLNTGETSYAVQIGERIAQLVFAPVVQAVWDVDDELPATERGSGGFGSTGVA